MSDTSKLEEFIGVKTITEDIVTELRNTCLARLDPNVIAAMPAERLIMDVERLISVLQELHAAPNAPVRPIGTALALLHGALDAIVAVRFASPPTTA